MDKKTIKDIKVTVTYTVGLGDHEATEKQFDELKEVFDKGKTINGDDFKYSEALEWLNANIDDSDAMDWEYEITDLED